MVFTKTITCPHTNQTFTDAAVAVLEVYDFNGTLRIHYGFFQSADDVGTYIPCGKVQ